MKKTILLLTVVLLSSITFAQQKDAAEKLVNEGIAYYDKGDYEGAVVRYDMALGLDSNNVVAYVEKAMTLLALKKYEETIDCCRKTIEKFPGNESLATLYVTYGNVYDEIKKTDKSVDIYNEGLKLFPDYYQLHFNKGITYASVKKYDEAIACFQQALLLNANHPGSHNALARMLDTKHIRIPALLAYFRFMALEPQSQRAKSNLDFIQQIMKGNVEQKDKKTININISSDMLPGNGAPTENNFSIIDMILSMDAALDYDKKYKDKTEIEQFLRKFDHICTSLKEGKNKNSGFYWDYYAPYFIEMKDKKLTETYVYIAFASSDNQDVALWLKAHEVDIDKFFAWSKAFVWKKK